MQTRRSNLGLRIILPVLVLIGTFGIVRLMILMKPEQEKNPHVAVHPKIKTHEVMGMVDQILVKSQGTVRPRQQTRLTARVSGLIEWVSPAFYEGGRFQAGEKLLSLDPLPYESAVAEAQSRLALTELAWQQEKEAAEQARRDWESVGMGKPTPLVLREPQIARAAADREAAKLALEMARRNLLYTDVRAPYNGRVLAKHVDVGQSITAQATVLGDIYATDSMEIAVPLSQDDLAYIEMGRAKDKGSATQPAVYLQAEIAGQVHKWRAWLDRSAAAIDERSRMITAIVRIEAPFLSDAGADLLPGMFVRTEIATTPLEHAIQVPRGALHPGNTVYRLTEDNRLESVQLSVVRTDEDWAIVTNGLQVGDRLCTTPLLFFVEGMRVEPDDRPAPDNTDKP